MTVCYKSDRKLRQFFYRDILLLQVSNDGLQISTVTCFVNKILLEHRQAICSCIIWQLQWQVQLKMLSLLSLKNSLAPDGKFTGS